MTPCDGLRTCDHVEQPECLDALRLSLERQRRDGLYTHGVAVEASRLVVHLLDDESIALARLFGEQTGDDVDKFTACAWRPGPDGLPVLEQPPAWFSGTVRQRSEVGDHTAFLVEVDAAEVRRRPTRLLRLSDVDDFDPGHEA